MSPGARPPLETVDIAAWVAEAEARGERVIIVLHNAATREAVVCGHARPTIGNHWPRGKRVPGLVKMR